MSLLYFIVNSSFKLRLTSLTFLLLEKVLRNQRWDQILCLFSIRYFHQQIRAKTSLTLCLLWDWCLHKGIFFLLYYFGSDFDLVSCTWFEYFDFEILLGFGCFMMRKSLNSATSSIELEDGFGSGIINAYPLWSFFNGFSFLINQLK